MARIVSRLSFSRVWHEFSSSVRRKPRRRRRLEQRVDDLDRYLPSDHGATPAQVLAAWAVPAAMAAAALLLAGCAGGLTRLA